MRKTRRRQLISSIHKTLSVIELVNKYFDLVKIESGDYMLPLSRIHINEVCSKNVLDFYDLLTSKGLQVEIDIPKEQLFIIGNEEALNRVLTNLISNAIRYGRRWWSVRTNTQGRRII